MLAQATLDFLTKLEKNNNKPWFDKNKESYTTAKDDFEDFINKLHGEVSKLEPRMEGQRPKDSIFRIFRDVRFSKDKTPYKAHFSAYMGRGGRKAADAGFYVHIQPGKSFLAGGLWMPEGPLLKSTRQEIDYNFDEFKKILAKPDFRKLYKQLEEGDKLKTLPKGYAADNPAIEYLKMRSFIASTKIDDKDILSKQFVPKLVKMITVMKPLVDFLNRGLD